MQPNPDEPMPCDEERSLARVGLYRHTRTGGQQIDYAALLGWFVKFSSTDLAAITPAELLLFREEFSALQRKALKDIMGTYVVEIEESEAKSFHAAKKSIARYLGELTQTGIVTLGPFHLTVGIQLPRFFKDPDPNPPFAIATGEHVGPGNGQGVIYLFAKAVRCAGDRLRCCERCSALFVQARRKQRYCSRDCQQVASMRNLRARPKTKPHKPRSRRANDGSKKRAG